jgi:hypothetical protein
MATIYIRNDQHAGTATASVDFSGQPLRVAFSFELPCLPSPELDQSGDSGPTTPYSGLETLSPLPNPFRDSSRVTLAFVLAPGQQYPAALQIVSRRLREELGRTMELSFEAVDFCPKPFLTTAEIETLRLKYQGFTAKQVARIRACSPRTVEKHIENVYHKTGAQKLTPEMLRLMETCFYVLLPDTSWGTRNRTSDVNRPRSTL